MILRLLTVLALLCSWIPGHLSATDDSIDRALLVQKAMADARELLTGNDPAGAAKVLEAQLAYANVNRAYLDLLRKAYTAELAQLRASRSPDAKRIDAITKRLSILTNEPAPATEPAAPPPVAPPQVATTTKETAPSSGTDWLRLATTMFNQGKSDPSRFKEASSLFEKAVLGKTELNADQRAAWAYCRVKVAADELNKPGLAAARIRELEQEIDEALALAPQHAALQETGRRVLASLKTRTPVAATVPAAATGAPSGSFRVDGASPELAKSIREQAEKHRTAIYARWFGPAGNAWSPVCTIVVHPNAAAFAKATSLSERATGRAEVNLSNGVATARRIDLRADDPALLEVSLPRELAHIVLADLFPTKAPPRWAEEGIAVLSADRSELDRYCRAAPRCAADGQLPTAGELLVSTGFPSAERITGFAVASASLVQFLVSQKDEKAFAAFLTDGQRYGIETALKRQYNLTPQQLDRDWRRSVLISAPTKNGTPGSN